MKARICLSRVERLIQSLEQETPPSYNKQCTKGWSCGKTCISTSKKCSKTASGKKKTYAQALGAFKATATRKLNQEKERKKLYADLDKMLPKDDSPELRAIKAAATRKFNKEKARKEFYDDLDKMLPKD